MRALMALVPGANAGPYRIVEPLGRGGMATVYKAYEPKLDRYVALKVLPREFLHDPNFAQRFRQEAQVIARLEHPNIIPIYNYDIEEAEGIPWMAMRLIASGSLSDLLKRERPARARTVAILRGVAEALDFAHKNGIVHRDVKPQNVLLDEAARVYLADFGIAKMLESSGGLTASGMITGTPQYMAPEQATGLKIGPPADVYALGIMAYEMLVGRVPFSADTPVAVLMKHVQEPLPLPAPDVVPEPMLRALLKAAAKKPEQRWPTAGAFVDALAAGLGVPASVPNDVASDQPTVEVPRTLPRPKAPPTVVSPATARAPAGTAPPLPARPPIVRPPVTRAETVPVASRKPGTTAVLVGLGALGLVGIAVLVGAWLLLGRSQPVSPPEAPAAQDGGARVSVTPATTVPARPRDSSTVARGERLPAEQAPVPSRVAAAPTAASVPAAPSRPSPTLAAAATPHASPPAVTPATTLAAPPAPTPAVAPAVDPEVQRLASALADRDTNVRRQAALELATRGPLAAPAVPDLATALGDRSPDVRLRAAEALGKIGSPAQGGVPALAQALHDTDTLVASEAAKALGLIGEAAGGAATALGGALTHPAVGVRREAARALARLGRRAEPALTPLVAALSDKDKTVCAQAARALGHLGTAARPAVARLTALSKDQDILVSREAQDALAAIGRE
jgi:tRNA A-37 threonylcarbamoyl transferase component Bud32